jgi:Ca-activated chloride channel homolog
MTKQNKITLNMSWDKEVIPAEKKCERSLLINLKGEGDQKIKKKERPPVNLALVIDCSGSMEGAPIEAAKSAAKQITEELTQKDHLSIVSFDHEVETHFSNVRMDKSGASYAQGVISEIYTRGMTNLSGGWFEGARCATKAIDQGDFNDGFVVVLSDGMANRGITDPKELQMHAAELSSRGIQTTSIGIGAHYSPLQLDALAIGGQGRLHDTETAEDIIDVVLGELGEIGNTIARNVKLHIQYPESVELKCLSKLKGERSGNFYNIHIGNLQLNQTKSVALLSEIYEQTLGQSVSFEVHVTWDDMDTNERFESKVITSSIQAVSEDEANRAEINTSVVQKIADLWEASLAYEAMIFNEQGRFDAASSIYENNKMSYNQIIDSLEDRDKRMDRFKSVHRKVNAPWVGRSKRASFDMSKKMMMGESSLLKRNTGDWHDDF